MKSNDLLDAIGEVSDEYIADAENVKKRRMPRWARWSCAAAACLVAVAGIGGVLIHIGMDVGISGEKGETEGFAELNLMYQMARAATAYRFIYGMGAVVTEGEMAQRALKGEKATSLEELIQRLR